MVDNTPAAQPQDSMTTTQSSIVPGSAEDLRVNVGDTVHFDYNKYDVLDNDKSVLQRQAAWLGKYPSVRVTVEGHCDERGTREYNLALGARRANAVKEYLVSLGRVVRAAGDDFPMARSVRCARSPTNPVGLRTGAA